MISSSIEMAFNVVMFRSFLLVMASILGKLVATTVVHPS